MDFYEVVAKVIELLQREGRLTYRSLRRQFDLDDEALEDLKEQVLYSQPQVVDDEGKGLIWTGEPETKPESTSTQLAEPEVTQQYQPTQVKPPPEPPPPDAERRQLTILFTDLVDSTKLSSELDAEAYREVVRAYQTACAEVIERFECHLAQTLGDGLLIYSGYPVAHENDAERAVRAGLGILAAMKALNERLEHAKGICLAVCVGIHTGQVVVGDVGAGTRQEQLALGEVPNVAARIQGFAEPDTVVISAATYRLIQGYFECQTIGEQTLRGVTEPIAIYHVLRESGVQSRLGGYDRIKRALPRVPYPVRVVSRTQEEGLPG